MKTWTDKFFYEEIWIFQKELNFYSKELNLRVLWGKQSKSLLQVNSTWVQDLA